MFFGTKTKQTKISHLISPIKVIFHTINSKSDLVIVPMKSLDKKRGFQIHLQHSVTRQVHLLGWAHHTGVIIGESVLISTQTGFQPKKMGQKIQRQFLAGVYPDLGT